MWSFNWVDYVILALFAFSIISGFRRGLVKEVVSLITLIAAIVIAAMFATKLAGAMTGTQAVQDVTNQAVNVVGSEASKTVSYAAIGLSFGALFAGTVLVGSLIGYLFNLAFTVGVLDAGNRIFGAAFGLCRAFLITLAFIFILQMTAVTNHNAWKQSLLIEQYQPAVKLLGDAITPHLTELKTKAGAMMQKKMEDEAKENESKEQGVE